MTLLHRLISAGFALASFASASVPALAWSVWPDVDFEWYANVGRMPSQTVEVFPAARAGYIWSPGHYERDGSRQRWVEGHWIKDDYAEQFALYSHRESALPAERDLPVASGPITLHDRQGNVIPTNPEAYPLDSDSSRR